MLVIGDLNIPHREIEVPDKFKELLMPNKMQYVLCPGNFGSRETMEWLQSLGSAKSNSHFVRGDFDEVSALGRIAAFGAGFMSKHKRLKSSWSICRLHSC